VIVNVVVLYQLKHLLIKSIVDVSGTSSADTLRIHVLYFPDADLEVDVASLKYILLPDELLECFLCFDFPKDFHIRWKGKFHLAINCSSPRKIIIY
jgi:hypothetical protein